MALPSKKVIALGIIFITLVSVVFVVARKKNVPEPKQQKDINSLVAKKLVDTIVTTALSIGEEEAKKVEGNFDTTIDDGMATSSTYQFSKTFFGEYLEARGEGRALTQTEVDTLIQSYLYNNSTQSAPRLTLRDITIATSEDTASIRAYGNAVGKILADNTPVIAQYDNELFATLRGIYSEDPSEFEITRSIARGYQNSIKQMLLLSVPQSAVQVHLDFLNASVALLQNIQDMTLYEVDPLRTLGAIQNYQTFSESLGGAYNALGSYFLNKGIVFSTDDDGYALQIGL